MKISSLFISTIFTLRCFSQDSTIYRNIDSIISANDKKVETTFQKTERNRIESLHGKSPDYSTYIIRLSSDASLLSVDMISFSPGDTSMTIKLYFDGKNLIKAHSFFTWRDSSVTENVFYFDKNKILNVVTEPVYVPTKYLEWGQIYLKQLKKRPIRFPL